MVSTLLKLTDERDEPYAAYGATAVTVDGMSNPPVLAAGTATSLSTTPSVM